jgi:hypothetical protein
MLKAYVSLLIRNSWLLIFVAGMICFGASLAILHAIGMFVADLFKSKSRLEAENLLLRHQLTIALRQAPPRLRPRLVLSAYAAYYNQARTHLALQKDAPLHRAVQRSGAIVAIPILAGLHHQYVRI